MINFETLIYQNFQAVGNQSITINLNKETTTLVGGRNGAGKSTIVEALSYVLFGKALKSIKLAGLINTVNKKKMKVELNFSTNGKKYKIIRGEKPKQFDFFCDGVAYDQKANVRDTQAQIEYIIGFDFKLFTHMIVLNKERYVPFMDLAASDRRKVVEDILDINVFSFANDITKSRIKTINNTIANLEFERRNIETKIAGQERLINQAKTAHSESVTVFQTQVDEYTATKLQLEKENTKLATEKENLSYTITQKKKLESAMSQYKGLSVQFSDKMKSIQTDLDFYLHNEKCPTCGQKIEDHVISQKRDEASKSKNGIIETVSALCTEVEKTKVKLDNVTVEYEKYLDLDMKIKVNVQTLRSINERLTQLGSQIVKLSQKTDISSYESELETLNSSLIENGFSINQNNQELNELNQVLNLLKDTGIKSHIISEYLDFMNNKINQYLYAMDFYLNITLDENFKDTIHNPQSTDFTYDNLSTGQKCRVNLAIWLALVEVASIKNSVSTNLLFLDEILEPIDAEGIQMIMKLVSQKLEHKNIFVITQRFTEFLDNFRSSICFELGVDEFTTIV